MKLNDKILVTGGAGFVGSVLVPYLLSQGFSVKVYDNLLYGIEGLLGCFQNSNFEFIEGDVRDINKLKEASEDCKAVIHLAALVGYPICKKDPDLALWVNYKGTKNLVEAIPRDVPIIFASTGSCYGNLEQICKEDLPLKPLTIYGETKAMAEGALRDRGYFVIYRFATGYGISPRMRLDLLINDFVHKAVTEKNLIVYERYFQRTFIHVFDMAKAFLFALSNLDSMIGNIYNVGSEDMNLSKEYVAEFIKKKMPYYLHYADIGKDEDKRDYAVSYEKIEKLGYKKSVEFDWAIDRMISLFESFRILNKYSNV